MKKPEVSDPRYLRLLKGGKSAGKSQDEPDLFAPPKSPSEPKEETSVNNPDAEAMLLLGESDEEICRWIRRKTAEPDFKPALRLFNLFNLSKNPTAGIAKQLTLTVLKGTSFPDKRETCLEVIRKIRQGEHSGQINLIISPYEDPRDPSRSDPWAMKAIPEGYDEEHFLGYIPKAQGLNETFGRAIQKGIFCGCHIIGAKHTDFNHEDNQIITVICGWKNPQEQISA